MDANEWRENRPDSGMCLCLTDEQKEEAAARRGNTTWCLQVCLTEREKSSETNSSWLLIKSDVYFHWPWKQWFAYWIGRLLWKKKWRRGNQRSGLRSVVPSFIRCPFNPSLGRGGFEANPTMHWAKGQAGIHRETHKCKKNASCLHRPAHWSCHYLFARFSVKNV